MEKNVFNEWLINEKKLTSKSARDVVSRYVRVSSMLGSEPKSIQEIDYLADNDLFIECTKTVKSQLRRAIRLYIEYLEVTHGERKQ